MSERDIVRPLAQVLANDAIAGIEFLSASELADEQELELTEEQLEEAHRLATLATAVLPKEDEDGAA